MMTNTRADRRTRLLAGLAGVTLLLGACSGGGKPAGGGKDAAEGYDPNAQVTLTWWTGQTTEAEQAAEQLAAEYSKAHPNVTIKTSAGASTTDDLLTKLSAGFTGGSYPDISYAYGSWAGELATSGKTQNLAQYVADPSFGWAEIPAAARETVATPKCIRSP
jgi:multiple sugar transport system substrate-binding protein